MDLKDDISELQFDGFKNGIMKNLFNNFYTKLIFIYAFIL